ncbi:MAG: hypothetical protein AAFO07_09080 [Bacteroidota bacterium]
MKQSHPIDDLFKQKLGEHELAPPMHLWDAIAQKKPKRRGFVFWWSRNGNYALIGLALTIFAASLFYLIQSEEEEKLNYFKIDGFGNDPVSTLAAAAAENVTDGKVVDEKAVEETTVNQIAEISDHDQPSSTHSFIGNSENSNVALNSQSNKTINNSSEEVENLNAQELLLEEGFLSNLGAVADQWRQTANHLSRASNVYFEEKRLQSSIDLFDPLQNDAFLEEYSRETIIPAHKLKKARGINYYLEAYGATNFVNRTLSTENAAFEDLMNQRVENEEVQLAFSAGMNLMMVNQKGLSLRTGFQYTQIREDFSYFTKAPELKVTLVYGPNGSIVGTDTVLVQQGDPTIYQNQFSFVNIPVLLGYEKKIKRFTIGVNAGPIFNIAFQRKGTFLASETQLATIEEADDVFRNSIGINWYTGLNLQYEISPGMHLLVEPHLRLQSFSINQSNSPIQQKYSMSGISFGVRKLILR